MRSGTKAAAGNFLATRMRAISNSCSMFPILARKIPGDKQSRCFGAFELSGAARIVAAVIGAAALSFQMPQARAAQNAGAAGPRRGVGNPLEHHAQPLTAVVSTMSRDAGAIVLADSSVRRQVVMPPAQAVTADTLSAAIDALVKTLPTGTTWARVYLPVGPGQKLDPDAVSDYVFDQARLFGGVGAATTLGTVEIMGQKVPEDKATAVIAALNLKPVYLITNPRLRAAAARSPAPGAASGWAQMSADERRLVVQQQAQALLAMDPAAWQGYFQQELALVQEVFNRLTPEQKQQFNATLGGSVKVTN